jgi:crotonobetainyl-CoA:carnitine CoA-transferase CaiB-like acyl-CoA transferase
MNADRREDPPRALAGVRVIEWAEGFAGPLCARLLGDLGADVIKIETPAGDWTRGDPLFPALNYNKRSVIVDPTDPTALAFARELLASADIVIEAHPPGRLDALGLGFDALAALRPGLILVSLTPFGQWGPRAHWRGEDLIAIHSGGIGVLTPDWVADPQQPPLRPAPRQGEAQLALNGAIAALGALYGREIDAAGARAGVHIDVAAQECVAAILHTSIPEYIALGRVRNRFRPSIVFSGFTPAKDGLVRLAAITPEHWRKVGELIGAEELVSGDVRARLKVYEQIEARAAAWADRLTRDEVEQQGQALRLPFAKVNKPSEVVRDPHFVARGAFITLDQPGYGRLTLPGAPFRMSRTPWRIDRPAPVRPGEHDAEVRAELAQAARSAASPAALPARPPQPYLPLRGVRVLDCSWAWAGPHCAIQLADMGAEVIKLESRFRLDSARSGGPFPSGVPVDVNASLRFTIYNRNKAGITLNLRHADGLALARRLVAVCDVFIENFAPGVIDRLGLGYDALRAIRPDIVMISLSGFGNSGPKRDYVAYGYTIDAAAGLSEMTGYRGGGPQAMGLPYPDPAGGLAGAIAVLAALRHRLRTGEGQHIDLSEAESLLTCLTEGYALLAATGEDPLRLGNADRLWHPSGVYPCQEGRWLALAVENDAQWQALLRELGPVGAPLARPELAHAAGRLAARDEIDAHLSSWTSPQEVDALAERLQRAGVPAAPVQNAEQVFHDPHLRARGFWQMIEHPGYGPRPVYTAPYRFSTEPLPIRRAAPRVGEDNESVLRDLLGLSAEQFSAYVATEAIA